MGATSVWAAVTEPELDAIGAASWRSWPSGVPLRVTPFRDDAVLAAKGFAREHGAGCVLKLAVRDGLHERTAIDANVLNEALTAAIAADAEYLGVVDDLQIRAAEEAMGLKFPMAWRKHVQSTAWFRGGWMRTGAYVWLYTPSETAELISAWGEAATDRAGMLAIGGDGGGEMITLDARDPNTAVTLTPMIGIGWADSIEQAASIEPFIRAIEEGSFEFVFERS